MPAEEKHLLQTAAVIGNELSLPLLQAIAELPEDTLHRGLAHLQAAEFLYETSLFPELAYTFKHALTRDVAYGGLLHERRRMLHGRVGVVIEELYAGRLVEYVETLAYHFEQGEVWARAVHYLLSAAEKAKTQYAYPQAVHSAPAPWRLRHMPRTCTPTGCVGLPSGGPVEPHGRSGAGQSELCASPRDHRRPHRAAVDCQQTPPRAPGRPAVCGLPSTSTAAGTRLVFTNPIMWAGHLPTGARKAVSGISRSHHRSTRQRCV